MSIFADHAPDMRKHGLAVLPVDRDKQPQVSGFNKWSRPPGARTVSRWCETFADSNIAIVPGLSKVTVADCDTMAAVEQIERILGKTDLRVLTSRGKHLF